MSPARMTKIEASIRIVLAFNEAFNKHYVDGMMKLMSEDCVFENTAPAPDGTVYSGREVIAQFWRDFFHESPPAHIDIEDVFGFGFRCIMRWKYNWGTGHVRGVDIFQIRDGLIVEQLSYVKR